MEQTDGLTYTNEPIGEIISKDTDGDKILDWEEGLWGTDPTKKDTDDDGITDDIEITKLKTEAVGNTSLSNSEVAKLTETEKFSDQLFATAASLTENGTADETILNNIGLSLVDNLEKTVQKKVYTIKNIPISEDDSKQVMQIYSTKILAIQAKYPLNIDITAIAATSIRDDGEIDASAFKKFDPAIGQINGIVKEMLTVNTPRSVSILHVMVINGFQRLSENLENIKLAETDPIVALGAMKQYEKNSATLVQYISMLGSAVSEKLNN